MDVDDIHLVGEPLKLSNAPIIRVNDFSKELNINEKSLKNHCIRMHQKADNKTNIS